VGLIVNGKPTRGLGHCELGHVRVPRLAGDTWPGHCPYHGDCVEGLASGPAIKARLGPTPLHEVTAQDPVWTGVAHALAQMCHAMLMSCAPRRILIGGGVANGQPQLRRMIEDMVRDSVADYIPCPTSPLSCRPRLAIRPGRWGPSHWPSMLWKALSPVPRRRRSRRQGMAEGQPPFAGQKAAAEAPAKHRE
jgi:fructokinase